MNCSTTAVHSLPFGGVGFSGIGKYHGRYTFDTFTHLKSILVKNPDFDMDIMYPPYSYDTVTKIRKFFSQIKNPHFFKWGFFFIC